MNIYKPVIFNTKTAEIEWLTGEYTNNEWETCISENALCFTSKDRLEEFLLNNLYEINRWLRKNKYKLLVNMNDHECSEYIEYLENINTTDEEMEAERTRRVKALNLESSAEKDILKNKTLWIAENLGLPWGVNYFLPGYTYEKEVRACMEKLVKGDNVPYFAIVDHLKNGELLISFLFVSIHKDAWDSMECFHDRNYKKDMEKGEYVDAWVFNTNFMEIPDLGTIQIKRGMGSLKRVG